MRSLNLIVLATAAATLNVAAAQPNQQTVNDWRDAFRQLEDEDWPTPNRERRATGAPGPDYWQQQVDYDIDIRLDEEEKHLYGVETITYTNNAPDTLDFLWFQLDQNRFRPDSIAVMTETVGGGGRSSSRTGGSDPEGISASAVRRRQQIAENGYGHNITGVTDVNGEPMDFTIVDTLMRIDLDEDLTTGDSVTFTIEWDYRLVETQVIGGRAGWECFEETEDTGGDCIYQIAQWFPRAAAFS
ncbi:MAG: aminopeptidase, partial [Alphaproteobacteria bacterium]|nr:aminopeptidase [Alphaproteobacteria bacterium]